MAPITRWLTHANPIYIRLSRRALSLRDSTYGRVVEDLPLLALTESGPIPLLCVGHSAKVAAAAASEAWRLLRPFGHP